MSQIAGQGQEEIYVGHERYQELFQSLADEGQQIHEANRRRIQAGIRCLIWIPMVFLALLLMTGSEKVIFLVLWIVSLFAISGYLIYVEYIDYKAQEWLHKYTDQPDAAYSGLIGGDIEAFEEAVEDLLRQIDEKKAQKRQIAVRALELKKDQFLEAGRKGIHHE